MRAAVDRTVPARLLPDPDAVCDLGCDRAADRAMCAHTLTRRDLGTRGRRWPCFGLADAAERHCAEPRKRARGDTRPPQKAASVEAAIRLAVQGKERPAAGLWFRCSEHHGVAPHFRS